MASPIDADLLKRYGLEGAVKTVELNPAMFPAVKQTLEASGLASADTKTGNLLFNLSSGLPEPRLARRDFVARYVGEGKLLNGAQLTAAMDFFKKRGPDAEFSIPEFEAACGSGITFSDEQLGAKVVFSRGFLLCGAWQCLTTFLPTLIGRRGYRCCASRDCRAALFVFACDSAA